MHNTEIKKDFGMKNEHSAGVIVYYKSHASDEPSYLILHYGSGHWDFPKGKLEASETEIEAALRELKEETALEAMLNPDFEESLAYFFRSPGGELVHKKVTFFIGETFRQDVTLSYEHVGYKWLTFAEAERQLTFENARQILINAHQFIKSLSH